MKKIKSLILLFAIVLLSGCSSLKIDINDFEQIMDSNFEHMLQISENELVDVYGIDLDQFKQYLFKVSYEEPTNIYVLVLPNGSKKEAKKEINKFFNILETKVSDNDKKRIKNKYVKSMDDYLIYLVSDNNKELYKKIEPELTKEDK